MGSSSRSHYCRAGSAPTLGVANPGAPLWTRRATKRPASGSRARARTTVFSNTFAFSNRQARAFHRGLRRARFFLTFCAGHRRSALGVQLLKRERKSSSLLSQNVAWVDERSPVELCRRLFAEFVRH